MTGSNYPLWLIKLVNYEYWPSWAFYTPLFPYLLWLAVRARSLTFFTAVDSCMPMGGLMGETKSDIFDLIPPAYLPNTLWIEKNTSFSEVITKMENSKIEFPLIAKPNVGERGYMVAKLSNVAELENYINSFKEDFILQTFLDLPIELGVFFIRGLNGGKGFVSSVTSKEFLSVKGNGKDSMLTLLQSSARGRFQIEAMKLKFGDKINDVPESGKLVVLEPIGNHCRGTRFINANHLINEQLHQVFRDISSQIKGFDYGRYDLKVSSIESLYAGENIRIMELNGVSSEPGHIYDQSVGLFKAWRTLAWHWKQVFNIYMDQRETGLQPVGIKAVLSGYKNHLK